MLHLLTADHRTHGLDLVAQLGTVAARLGPDLQAAFPTLHGVVVLGTCNRLTLILDAPDHCWNTEIARFLAVRAGISELSLDTTHGPEALTRLFATAAGLESMVVGEREIAGQLRRAMMLARDDGTLTGMLARVIDQASATSRRVAATTSLAGTGRSVVGVGLDLAATHLPPMPTCRALIVGTGAYAGATVTALRARGLTQISVYSRSERAQRFAEGHHLHHVTEDDLPQALATADLVVTCRGLGTPVLTRALVEPAARARTNEPVPQADSRPAYPASHPPHRADISDTCSPFVILDLALSRDVDAAVGDLPGVLLINLATVHSQVPEAEAAHVHAARAIVAADVEAFTRAAGGRRMDPVIAQLRAHVSDLVEHEVNRLPVRDGVVSADAAAYALRRLAARLLHHPSVAARQAGEAGRDEDYLNALPMLLGQDVTRVLLSSLDAPHPCPLHPDSTTEEDPHDTH